MKRQVGWLNEHSYLDLHVIMNLTLVKSINNDINTNKLNIQSYNPKCHPSKIEREKSDSVETLGVLKFLKIANAVGVKFWIKHSIANSGKTFVRHDK